MAPKVKLDRDDSKRGFDSGRRRWLRGAAALTVGAALPLTALRAAAAAKASKKSVQYQDSPKNGQKCSDCLQFQAPDACKIVAGKIDPNGYCVAFQAKS